MIGSLVLVTQSFAVWKDNEFWYNVLIGRAAWKDVQTDEIGIIVGKFFCGPVQNRVESWKIFFNHAGMIVIFSSALVFKTKDAIILS